MLGFDISDHRVFERFSARFPAKFKHIESDYGTEVFLRDASAQGIKLTTHFRFFLNDCLSLLVNLPDGHSPLTLNGRVVWVQRKSPNLWDVGLKFHKIDLMQMQRIYRLIYNSR